jgi:cell division protein FtsI (penicillin-binding protein 3)
MSRHHSIRKPIITLPFWERRRWILGLFIIIIMLLLSRAAYLQIMHKDFLQSQGNARHLRTLPLMAYRGQLQDRYGEPLAVSTPVDSVWVNPTPFVTARSQWSTLAALLDLKLTDLEQAIAARQQREFVYLKRHISPNVAEQVKALQLPGVFLQREYRRYYPTGEISAHLLGFTNVDDQGQEGLELALEDYLRGIVGSKRVLQDGNGLIVAEVETIKLPHAGQDIRLSIDRRLQYLAYRELKAAVAKYQARAGSAVILDVHTGEVLALVNQPAFNPNSRLKHHSAHYRNRVITDVFEPGSTFKPFTIISALESGQYTPLSRLDTRPGYLTVGKYTVEDERNHGIINLTTLLQKSSNVGASKIALALTKKQLWYTLRQLGFGQISGCGFPGEVSGNLPHYGQWQRIEQATIAFGYGVNATLLQLARAYAAIGNEGILPPIRLLALEQSETVATIENEPTTLLNSLPKTSPSISEEKELLTQQPTSKRIMQVKTAWQVLKMMEAVVKPGGTGTLAQVRGFRVAGKTGTVRKAIRGGYSGKDYQAVFVGIVPASAPRLVMAVIINEPRQQSFYGGEVAAPIFAKVMAGALRLLGIPLDDVAALNKR